MQTCSSFLNCVKITATSYLRMDDSSFFVSERKRLGCTNARATSLKQLYEQYGKDGQSRKTLKAQQLWAF
ncbi:hypothetical protein PsorP6_015481 [Peronosclerospora sorghi]|uniref:Uncharacterized protein n=1 Tax=Peronosclerospora sorghi TaxID=230839 RepID=A0ACC0WR64_9STRA|nr:hypothetical protein PsorP6_015481 [Peronosclerospora sorghi]